jgi:hypothetical protein
MPSIQWIEHYRATDTVIENKVTSDYPPKEIRLVEISFRVYYNGLNHVAGIVFSTDGWKSRQEAFATFQTFCGDQSRRGELWKVEHGFPPTGAISFEYVIWCEDYRCIDSVKRIYKTDEINGGQPFIV